MIDWELVSARISGNTNCSISLAEALVCAVIQEMAHSPPKSLPLRLFPKHFKIAQAMDLLVTPRDKEGQKGPMTTAMLDSGSCFDVMSPKLAKQLDLKPDRLPSSLASYLNGTPAKIYGLVSTKLDVLDTTGIIKTQTVSFVLMDTPNEYPIVLGMPWLETWNPVVDFKTRQLVFNGERREGYHKVRIIRANDIASELEDGNSQLYVGTSAKVASVVPLNSLSSFIELYSEHSDVFDQEMAEGLPEHGPQDLAIDLVEGKEPPFGPLYNLSEAELAVLREYLDTYCKRGWIRESTSPAGAPILFVKKKDGSLRLCVDYRGLNNVTIKNRHPLPLIEESLDRLGRAKIFTSLDLREAYHRLRIRAGDEWKTAFRTRYGHFEYTVVPFGLTNAPAAFQAYINRALTGLVDIYCIVYLDDILIFSEDEKEHVKHVKEVLKRLKEHQLYVNLRKSTFHSDRTEYLGYIVTPDGISIDKTRISAITNWPIPKNVHEVREFVGFINYYRRFIPNFSHLAEPLTALTKKGPEQAKRGRKLKQEELVPIELSSDATNAFQSLKDSFLNTPILTHFDPTRPTILETDASGRAICGILSQLVPYKNGEGQWRPVAFASRKLSDTETRYHTHDLELLAIVWSCEKWRHYLEGLKDEFVVLTDHMNLKWFMKTKSLSRRQAGWASLLANYHFLLSHRPGKLNPADGPSRRPDYMVNAQDDVNRATSVMLAGLQTQLTKQDVASLPKHFVSTLWPSKGLVEAFGTIMEQSGASVGNVPELDEPSHEKDPTVGTAPEQGELPEEDTPRVGNASVVDEPAYHEDTTVGTVSGSEPQEETGESIRREARFVPERYRVIVDDPEERKKILAQCHDDPSAGHGGIAKTLEHIQRYYTWHGLRKNVKEYVSACVVCKESRSQTHAQYGHLLPLPVPEAPWDHITVDFITQLPPSKFRGVVYDTVAVFVDKFTKMAHYVPTTGDLDAKGFIEIFDREIFRLHGVPKSIVSDRASIFTSKYWNSYLKGLGGTHKYSTAYHPQTDGQTERQNQILEQYLRIYCSWEQDDWAKWCNFAEFAYNDSIHSSTGLTPFVAYTGRDPRGHGNVKEVQSGDAPAAFDVVSYIIELQALMRTKLEQVRRYQSKQYNRRRKELVLKVGDEVFLNTKNIKTLRPKKKLDKKFVGPLKITEVINRNAYRLELPSHIDVHPVFHVSLLEPYTASERYPQPKTSLWDTLDPNDGDVYTVEGILGHRVNDEGFYEYLVLWENYSEEEATWEVSANLTEITLREYRRDLAKKGLSLAESAQTSAKGSKVIHPESRKDVSAERGQGRPRKRRRIVQ